MSQSIDTVRRSHNPIGVAARAARSRPRRLFIGLVAVSTAALLTACTSATSSPSTPTDTRASVAPTAVSSGAGDSLGSSAGGKDSSTRSYLLTSSTYTVKGDNSDGPHTASCGDGWYVRAAPGGSVYDPIKPSVHLDVSNASGNVGISSAEPADFYGSSYGVFQSFKLSVRSWTPYTHTYKFSWWCDYLPSWWKANPQESVPSATVAKQSGRVGDIKNMDLDALINAGPSHWTLNNSGDNFAENNPIIGWPFTAGASNQKLWGIASSADYDGLPVYSFWAYQPVFARWVITADPGGDHALHIHSSGGSVPRGGFWALIQAGVQAPPGSAGAWNESTLVYNTDYDECLTGATDQGVALELAPCDTADPNQYWTLKPMKPVGP